MPWSGQKNHQDAMSDRSKVNCVDWKRYLGFGGWVSNTKGFKEVGTGQSQVGTCASLSGVWVSFQHEGVCHATQGLFDGLGSSLPAFSKESTSGKANSWFQNFSLGMY
jgi:hypothetical protein